MDWTAGYTSDIEYTPGFYHEQSPTFLNFVCVLNGIEPIDLGKPFTYCELGFGRGLTVNTIAASHPQGQFYAADFNPTHVAGARQLASSAGLRNLTLLENSFADLADGNVPDLPQFDMITLHGIYTWVNAACRNDIVRFVNRYLKPGGVVYVSYNAMPGWSNSLPLQRLLLEVANLQVDRSDVQMNQAITFAEKMHAAQAAYFNSSPQLAGWLERIKGHNRHYLVHEYLHRAWEPLYHADVARDFSQAKLDYVGPAELTLSFPETFLNAEKRELLNTIHDRTVRETMRDYFLNTRFRKDVFVRGGRRMPPVRHMEMIKKTGLAFLIPRNDAKLKMALPMGEVNGKEELYAPIFHALGKRPHTLGELAALPELAGQPLNALIQAAVLLTTSGQTGIYCEENATAPVAAAQGMNRALAEHSRYSDDYKVLASPLLGNGINTNIVERMIYLILTSHAGPEHPGMAEIADSLSAMMAAQGIAFIKDGKPVGSEEEKNAELRSRVDQIMSARVPVWKQLKML
jgi:SAM-dependent methyltransferase